MAKPRVTRRIHVKKPWYERPGLLFGALIVVLGIGGILIARLMSGGGVVTTLGGPPAPDDATAQAPATPVPAPTAMVVEEDLTGILGAGDPLPAAEPGRVLPPIRIETTAEAAEARRALRQARAIEVPVFVEGAKLVEAAAGGPGPSPDALPLRAEQRAFCDFEVMRESDGTACLVGFVSVDVARALAELGPSLTYPAAGQEPPGWQVWKKRGGDRLVLRAGSEVTLFPDLGPAATCIVALPLRHLQPLRVQRVQTGLAQPAEVLEAALR